MEFDKLIILTTATCRPIIHNIAFSQDNLQILNNIPFKIKWIINIDKTKICPSNQDETVINLKRLLNGYDIEFIISKKPSFFIAFKNLVIKATEYLNKKSVIFNLEDDWIVNDSIKFDLFDIIQKYHSYNSYISFVFNKFCTLPPCLIGFEIFKHYINDITTIEGNHKDPETFIRGRTRTWSLKYNKPINSFLINYDIKSINNLLKKKDKIISKQKIGNKDWIMTYGSASFPSNKEIFNKNNKNYLVKNINKINENIKEKIFSCSNQDINIISYNDFNKIINLQKETSNNKEFNFIRFGGVHHYMNREIDYNNTFYKDLGRFKKLGESPKISTLSELHSQREYKDVILTIYYFNQPDPQRKKNQKSNDFNYIKNFYTTVKDLNLNCIIFHDGLSNEFIKQYETDIIEFILFNHEDYPTSSGNDTRFLVYLEYLKKNNNINNVFISDISGVTIFKNPFEIIKNNNVLYVSPDRSRTKKNKIRNLTHYWFKEYAERSYGSFQLFEEFKNNYSLQAGLFGGSYLVILNLLEKMSEQFKIANINTNTNYVVYNYIVYKYFNNILKIGKSTHNGYEEINYNPFTEYIFETRTGNIYSKIFW